MAIKVSSSEKKAEIARDIVVAYLSHVKDEQLADLDQISTAIQRLVTVVDSTFEASEKATTAGFGLPTIPQVARHEPQHDDD